MGKLSIDEIAERAFVSRSVVSRVLNNRPNVSDDARKRVQKVIKKYNYRPSSVARGLATSRSYEIGILAPRRCDEALGNGFWSLLHLGIFEECIQKGYFVTMSPIVTDKDAPINENILDSKRLDGYILLTEEVTSFVIDTLKERDLPIVLVGHDEDNTELSSVDIDNYAAGYQATRHLIELGHKYIGTIAADIKTNETSDRLEGYKTALQEAGLPIAEEYISTGNYSQQHGFDTIQRWNSGGMEVSAIVCTSDTLAMGALSALDKAGIRVPLQVAVVGFDNLPFSQYTIPALTTIKQPIYEKGKRAAQLLIKRIENKNSKPLHESLKTKLIIRESCGANTTSHSQPSQNLQ